MADNNKQYSNGRFLSKSFSMQRSISWEPPGIVSLVGGDALFP